MAATRASGDIVLKYQQDEKGNSGRKDHGISRTVQLPNFRIDRKYFLEMIDPHHRYGSSLKAYHTYWMKHTDNKDNFFRWLDEEKGYVSISLIRVDRDPLWTRRKCGT